MKKFALIEYLKEIKGNPDVYFYNGYVDDYQDLHEPEVYTLVKETKELRKNMIDLERKQKGMNQLTDEEISKIKDGEWEFDDIMLENVDKSWYKKKKVILLEAKPRNKTTWDRMGTISY